MRYVCILDSWKWERLNEVLGYSPDIPIQYENVRNFENNYIKAKAVLEEIKGSCREES